MSKWITRQVGALIDPDTLALVGFEGADGDEYILGARIDWFLIDGDVSILRSHAGRTAEITANANIQLPPLASVQKGFVVELVPDGAHTITLVPTGAETVQGTKLTVTGPCSVCKSRLGDRWIAMGEVSA